VPGHPVFDRLPARYFDGWNGGDSLICTSLVAPLSVNALAAAGSYGPEGQLAAVVEGAIGKGSFLMTQLQAVERYASDPVAARFVDNVLRYAVAGEPQGVREVAESNRGKFLREIDAISAAGFARIDLRPFVNRPLAGTVGGGSSLDYRNLPTGTRHFMGIPFEIIQPEKKQAASLLVLQGNRLPELPKEILSIPVRLKSPRLFFMHSAFYPTGNVMAHYRIRYSDGTTLSIPLDGKNLGDWFRPADLVDSFVAWADQQSAVGFFLFPWKNPHPEKEIDSIDILSEGTEQHSGGSLILAAITAQKRVD